MALNAKQQRFVSEYLIDLNATQAAIRAGYSQKTAIYALSDPDGRVRYVGKAINPEKRLKQHLRSRANLPVSRWVRKLRANGRTPTMRVIDWTHDWEAAERRWIAAYRADGNLLNLADGGAGVPGSVADWAMRNAVEYAEELLSRIKPFAAWVAERKRSGCDVLLYWSVLNGLADIRSAALRTRA